MAAFAGAGVAAFGFGAAAQRFLWAAAMRRRAAGDHDALGRFIESEPDRPFEALWPRDEYPDAARERVRGDPGFVRLSEALSGGLDGRLNTIPPCGSEYTDTAPRAGFSRRTATHLENRLEVPQLPSSSSGC